VTCGSTRAIDRIDRGVDDVQLSPQRRRRIASIPALLMNRSTSTPAMNRFDPGAGDESP